MPPLEPDDPREIGGHRILARLGAGGMGQVFLGRSAAGLPVAVKLIREQYGLAATGTGPFGTGPAHSMIYRVLHEEPDLARVPDPGLRAVLAACLVKDPARPPAVDTVLQWLAQRLPQDRSQWWPPTVTAEIAERTRHVPQHPIRTATTMPPGPGVPTRPPGGPRLARRRVLTVGLAAASAGGVALAGGAWLLRDSVFGSGSGGGDYAWTWKDDEGGRISAGPVVAGGLALVYGRLDGGDTIRTVHALDARTGKERWKTTYTSEVFVLLGVAGGLAYVYTVARRLSAVDIATGKERWSRPVSSPDTGLVVGDGLIFLDAPDQRTGARGILACDAATGGGWVPSVVDGTVYIAGAGGTLNAIDDATKGFEARARWTFSSGGSARPARSEGFLPTPAVTGGVAAVFNGDGQLAGVDVQTGRTRWQVAVKSEREELPKVAGGLVHLACLDSLISVAPATGKIVQRVEGLRPEHLTVAGDLVYFAGGPAGDRYRSTVYAMKPPQP